MDTTDLQLTDYLQVLQATVNSHHDNCRIVILEAGSDTREPDRFMGRQFRLRLQHYMLTSRARLLETKLAIPARSTHFLLYQCDQLVAVLRVTPSPFEWASLAQRHLSPTVALSRHVEFSRLITHSQNQQPVWVNGLLAAATEWAIQRGYRGVTALCRSPQRRLFQRFGLTPISADALHLDQRARGDYWLLSAEWGQILAAVQQPVHATANPLENHDECARQF
ncbi:MULTISPECIES: hypothetical protein [Pseudomonas]|uniref:N-acetyltransferase domain-containing protein n=1 Tax=Pseudomonas baetica TaxID=674054 RepID=A0ABX4Q089_9PSED|nr:MULTISPECIES: hypothetical protein [Pseudomonas]PKA70182.1 hypothetical protein ATI02_3070 [Pseudomonas baetica]PTC21075.1 hypothetical protein C0J26_00230 [Pseudomonas baetica]